MAFEADEYIFQHYVGVGKMGLPIDPGCLEKAMEGCSGVHISLPTDIELQAVDAVVRVASTDGVERISYISGATVAEENCWFPMINRKYLAEKAIRESGIRYTIFCPTWIMESLPMFVNQGRAAVLGKQPYPYHWVAVGDIARMIATSYGLAESVNRRFIVHGPEAIRMDEALKRYCAVFHPEITEVSSMPLWLVRILAAITKNQGLKGAGELMSYFEKVGEGSNFPELDGILLAGVLLLLMTGLDLLIKVGYIPGAILGLLTAEKGQTYLEAWT